MVQALNVLGTRGVPAAHGGYETFASHLAPYLAGRGWDVTVYCQEDSGQDGFEDDWRGVRRVHFTATAKGAAGTMQFDAKCVRDVLKRPGIDLVLGYNTAVFNLVQKLRRRTVVMNMDGIEWQRQKWSFPAKAWFFLNELVGANMSTMLIADHPEMEKHLRGRARNAEIRMIAYGADAVTAASTVPLDALGLEPDRYLIKIARVAPENSWLPIIRAFSRQRRGYKLVLLGGFESSDAYAKACQSAASDEVVFAGTIFDPALVQALRFHARAYLHGHTVGGTNPSLCEALGAGNAVIAHDNRFNRWTAGEGQAFFTDENSCEAAIERMLNDLNFVEKARSAARHRHAESFTWPIILGAYEEMLSELTDRHD